MVRKRDAWTRARDRRRIRRKRPPPKSGWLIAELAPLSGQTRRTISYYVQQGLLAKPAFHGTATRYGRGHLLRLLCIEHLKRQGAGTLGAIRQRLDAMSEGDLLAMVASRSPAPAVAAALGLAASHAESVHGAAGGGVANGGAVGPGSGAAAVSADAGELRGEVGRRVPLLPGLELWVAANASAAVREVAQRIGAFCGSG